MLDPWVAAQLARVPPAALVLAERRDDAAHARMLLGEAASVVALAVLVASRWLARVRDAVQRDGPRPWRAAFACGAGFFLADGAIGLPFALAGGWLWPLGAPSLPGLLYDLILGVVFGGLLVALAYAGLRFAGRAWRLWASGLAVVGTLAWLALAPMVLPPLAHHARPAGDGAAQGAILAFLHADGFPGRDLRVSGGADPSDCDVEGLGPFAYARVSRAALATPPSPVCLAVLGHVMSHYRHGDDWTLALLAAAFLIGAVWLAEPAMRALAPLSGVREVADPAGLAVLMLVLQGALLLQRPAFHALDQAINYRADAEAVGATGSVEGLATWLTRYEPPSRPDPAPLEGLMFHSHPPLAPRLAAIARDARERGLNLTSAPRP